MNRKLGMADIFISYRREDSAGYAGRICDRLESTFGDGRVFMDVEDIRPGEDFTSTIEERIAACDVLIVVIGSRWLRSMRTRADQEDFVRQEVEAALKRNVTVIPVLVGGAVMPRPEELPPSLMPFSRHQALDVSDTRFDEDAARLALSVRDAIGFRAAEETTKESAVSRRWWWIPGIAVAISVMVLLFLTLRPAAPDISGVWLAQLSKEGQRPYRIRLSLSVSDGNVNGTVTYPSGDATIQDGKFDKGRLRLVTEHVPQFASEPARIKIEGNLLKDTLQITLTSETGLVTGLAKRAPSTYAR